jgi:hypothetical protein
MWIRKQAYCPFGIFNLFLKLLLQDICLQIFVRKFFDNMHKTEC